MADNIFKKFQEYQQGSKDRVAAHNRIHEAQVKRGQFKKEYHATDEQKANAAQLAKDTQQGYEWRQQEKKYGNIGVAFVDNAAEYKDKNYKSTDYGYQTVHADDLTDGTAVLLHYDGTYEQLEGFGTDDYKAQIQQYKDSYKQARSIYENARQITDYAESFDTNASVVRTSVSNTTLGWIVKTGDLIQRVANGENVIDVFKEQVDSFKTMFSNASSTWQYNMGGYENTAKLYVKNGVIPENYMNMIDTATGMETILNLCNSDNEKEADFGRYLAYANYTQRERGSVILGALNELGASGDTVANLVKGITGAINPDIMEGATNSVWENYKNAYSKGVNLQYNTGNVAADMALEIISDPSVWVTVGQNVLARSAGKAVASSVDDIGEQAGKTVKHIVSAGIKNGESADTIAAKLGKLNVLDVDQLAQVSKYMDEAADYAHYIKITSSLKKIDNILDDIDFGGHLIGRLLGGTFSVAARGVNEAGEFVKLLKETLSESDKWTAKAIADAISSVGGKVDFDNLEEFVTRAQLYDAITKHEKNLDSVAKLGKDVYDDTLMYLLDEQLGKLNVPFDSAIDELTQVTEILQKDTGMNIPKYIEQMHVLNKFDNPAVSMKLDAVAYKYNNLYHVAYDTFDDLIKTARDFANDLEHINPDSVVGFVASMPERYKSLESVQNLLKSLDIGNFDRGLIDVVVNDLNTYHSLGLYSMPVNISDTVGTINVDVSELATEAANNLHTLSRRDGDWLVQSDRYYVPTLSEMAKLEVLTNTTNFREAVEALTNYETTQYRELIDMVAAGSPAGSTAHSLYNYAQAGKRYNQLVTDVHQLFGDEDLANAYIDQLYNLDKDFAYSCKGCVTAGDISVSADNLVEKWTRQVQRNSALQHYGDYKATLVASGMDTEDTVANVRKMMTDLKPDLTYKEVPMYYSAKFSVGNTGCEELTLGIGDKVETFRIMGTIDEMQQELKRVQKFYTAAQQELGKTGQTIKMIGFNSGHLGRNSRARLQTLFHSYGHFTPFYANQCLDMADELKVNAHVFELNPELQDRLKGSVYQIMADYMNDTRAFNLSKTDYPMHIAPTRLQFREATESVLNSMPEDMKLSYEQMHKAVQDAQAEVTQINWDIKWDSITDDVDAVNKIADSDIRLSVKKLYDKAVASKYFDIPDDITFNSAKQLYDVAEAIDNMGMKMEDINIINDLCGGDIRMFVNDVPDYLNLKTNVDKAAYINYLYSTDEDALTDAGKYVAEQKKYYMHGDVQLYNRFEGITGAAVNPDGNIRRPANELRAFNETLDTLRCMENQYTAYADALKHYGHAEGSLWLQRTQVQADNAAAIRELADKQMHEVRRITRENNDALRKVIYKRGWYKGAPEYLKFIDEDFLKLPQSMQKRIIAERVPDGYNAVLQQSAKYATEYNMYRLAHIINMDDATLMNHFIKDCNGRLVLNSHTVDEAELASRLQQLGAEYKYKDGTHILWWNMKKYPLDLNNFLDVETLKLQVKGNLADIHKEVARLGGGTFTYGLPQVVNMKTIDTLDAQFFDGCEGLLSFGQIKMLGGLDGKANCMYHGDVGYIDRALGGNYMSNDISTNFFSAASQLLRTQDTDTAMLLNMFQHNDAAHLLDKYSMKDIVAISNFWKREAVDWYELKAHGNRFKVERINVNTHAGQQRLADPSRRIIQMNYADAYAVQKLAEGVEHCAPEAPSYLMQQLTGAGRTLNNLRSLYIQGYLYTNPATGIRNWLDSPLKATLKEGTDHFYYLAEFTRLSKEYDEELKRLMQEYGRHDEAIIDKFAQVDNVQLFKDYIYYLQNPVSGGMGEMIEKLTGSDMQAYFSTVGMSKELIDKVKKYYNSVPAQLSTDEAVDWLYDQLKVDPAFRGASVQDVASGYRKWATAPHTMDITELPLIGKYFSTNQKLFASAETYNRGAIWLKHMYEGDTLSKTLKATAETQFDYGNAGLLDRLLPFQGFRINNIRYWMLNAMHYGHAQRTFIEDMAKAFYQDDEDFFFNEDEMNWRTQMMATMLDNEELTTSQMFSARDAWLKSDMVDMGWLQIGDNTYLKTGNSLIDAMGNVGRLLTDINNGELKYTEDVLFKPLKTTAQLLNGEELDDYDMESLLPVLGSVLGLADQITKQDEKTNSKVLAALAGLITVQNDKSYKTTFKAYNQVNGYEVGARYVSTFGSMMRLGYTADQVRDLFDTYGAWWYEGDNLKNGTIRYDAEAYDGLFNKLVSWGIEPNEARSLLREAVTFKTKPRYVASTNVKTYHGYGLYSNGLPNLATAVDTLPKTYRPAGQPYVQSFSPTRNAKSMVQSNFHWRKNQRNIYKNLYAKYGASRMAMRQNLRNYSNRSITELHRTEGQQYYANLRMRRSLWGRMIR